MSSTSTLRGSPGALLFCVAFVLCLCWGETGLRAQSTQPTQSTQPAAGNDGAGEATTIGLGDQEVNLEQADISSETSIAKDSSRQAEDATATAAPAAGWNQEQRTTRAAMLIGSFTVFLLAVFVGFEIITKVPPTLHTPLMSGSNAISGITVVGAILTAGHALGGFGSFLGMLAVILATINVVGGFLVTHRMLLMFKKR